MCIELDAGLREEPYPVTADDPAIGIEQRDGIGKKKRAAEHIDGGALLGTINGAIAGGGKGAAISAAAGAGAGVVTQVLTRGKREGGRSRRVLVEVL